MKYVDELLRKTDFLQQLQKLEQLEKDREFCRHGLNHLLDTARIAWITYLEQQQNPDTANTAVETVFLDKEMIYLAALLHDLGRIQEYEVGISHHIASADMAEEYLAKLAYPAERIEIIVTAVYGHRRKQKKSIPNSEEYGSRGDISEECLRKIEALEALLYTADKRSRNCFYCEASEGCNWETERRNMRIIV